MSGAQTQRPGGDLTVSTDGAGPRLAWARTQNTGWGWANHSPYLLGLGGFPARHRNQAANLVTDHYLNNPVLHTIVEGSTVYAVGNGLTLSAKPDAKALGITDEAAADLSDQLESRWLAWSTNPVEVDVSGRFDIHELAAAAFRSYLRTGETVASLEWRRNPGAATMTKLQLLDASQIDQSRTGMLGPRQDYRSLNGVVFDGAGRVAGFWIIQIQLGAITQTTQPVFVAANTSWGRTRVLHLFDYLTPQQVRGISPLATALTPAHERNTLQEFELAKHLIMTQHAAVIKSAMATPEAFGALAINDGLSLPGNSVAQRADFYKDVRITTEPGTITHLFPTDSLEFVESKNNGEGYDNFDKSLTRSAAKSAGMSAESVSGDYSQTSFSASRLAEELPYRITSRRRRIIVERFYKAAYGAFLEEQFERGLIVPPKDAPEFWRNPTAYSAGRFVGAGRPIADPLKQSQADVVALNNNLTTLRDVLAERGVDLEDVIKQRKLEKQMLKDAGLDVPFTAGSVITNVTEDESEEPTPTKPPSKSRGPRGR